jgi:DNA-binding Lrp family transcriptional regulator
MHKSQIGLYEQDDTSIKLKGEPNNCKSMKSSGALELFWKGCRIMSRLLASVNIFVEQSQKDKVLAALSELKSIEEVYEVAGEYDIVSLVSASCIEEFRDVLQKKIMKIKGIKSTITTIILEPHKGPKCLLKKVNVSTLK